MKIYVTQQFTRITAILSILGVTSCKRCQIKAKKKLCNLLPLYKGRGTQIQWHKSIDTTQHQQHDNNSNPVHALCIGQPRSIKSHQYIHSQEQHNSVSLSKFQIQRSKIGQTASVQLKAGQQTDLSQQAYTDDVHSGMATSSSSSPTQILQKLGSDSESDDIGSSENGIVPQHQRIIE